MIHDIVGDIFTSQAEALVNTVNTQGIMGKGLALQFKQLFPENFVAYAKACKVDAVQLGAMFIFETRTLQSPKYIINFPTKRHWKEKSKLADIIAGLEALTQEVKKRSIASIAIPPLGCGLGGLNWNDVRKEIVNAFKELPNVDVQLYPPLAGRNPAPKRKNPSAKLGDAKVMLLASFSRYMQFAISESITFVEAHKLAYFLQAAGISLDLRFAAWKYGPFAKNLSHVFVDLEGEYIEGFRDGTVKAFETFVLLPAAEKIFTGINEEQKTRLRTVEDLCAGFETPLGMELLATLHWLKTVENIPADVASMYKAISLWGNNKDGWGDRKRKLFSEDLIRLGLNKLEAQSF